MKQFIAALLIALLAVPVTALADEATERDKTKKGAIIGGTLGAVAGAIIGNNRGKHSAKRGAVVGAVAGTAAGAIVGAMMDKQERELRQIEGVNVTRTDEDELRVTVRNEVLFDFDSAALRGSSRDSLQEMAEVFNRYPNTRIRVEGHTDSTGTASYNKRLSQRRAYSVENYLQGLGVRGSRIDAVGYGESQPRASNASARGRQLNRRVEIHIRATEA
ncbi:MAG TPA: OmpA family protein [Thermoanaerobaculia bacterium]|nr:OmpA family protein [Thermoanaerobaculia bacterium]